MSEFSYSFKEIVLLANKNINLINSIVNLEKIGIIKTELNAKKNDGNFKISDIDESFIRETKKVLDLSEKQKLTKRDLNKILKNIKSKNRDQFVIGNTMMNINNN